MSFLEAVETCFEKYSRFEGRAPRSEFWYWMLFSFLAGIVAGGIDHVLGYDLFSDETGPVHRIVSLGLLFPGIAVGVRRLHDTGKNGWWYWINFSIIGIIPFFIWMMWEGDEGENKYGHNPFDTQQNQSSVVG